MIFGNPIAKGNTADIDLQDGKIIKVLHPQYSAGEAEREAEKQRIAYSCGLLVPRIIEVTHIEDRQAIVMEHIKGPTLGEKIKQNMRLMQHYLALSVDTQIGMHIKSTASLESMTDKLTRQIQTAALLDKPCQLRLLKRLASLPSGNQLCHGDFHVFNLIESDSGIGIIDWVDSSLGNPCADVFRTYLLYREVSADLADTYLRLYCEKSELSRDDVFGWAPVVAGARLSENLSPENCEHALKVVRQYL